MPIHLLRVVLPSMLACVLGLQCAHADVYAWLDASGTVVYSDLAPPPGARIIDVVPDSAPAVGTRAAILSNHDASKQAEVDMLSERVRLLERLAELGARQALIPQYGAGPAPAMNSGCDYTWTDCAPWWGPPVYPGIIVVQRSPLFPRFGRFHRVQHFATPGALRAPGGFRVH